MNLTDFEKFKVENKGKKIISLPEDLFYDFYDYALSPYYRFAFTTNDGAYMVGVYKNWAFLSQDSFPEGYAKDYFPPEKFINLIKETIELGKNEKGKLTSIMGDALDKELAIRRGYAH